LTQCFDEDLAGLVGQGHYPAVDLAILVQASNILGRQAPIDDLAFSVALELLSSELSRRHVAKVHVGVVVEKVDQGLASVTAGANEANPRRRLIRSIILTQGGVRVRVKTARDFFLTHEVEHDEVEDDGAKEEIGERALRAQIAPLQFGVGGVNLDTQGHCQNETSHSGNKSCKERVEREGTHERTIGEKDHAGDEDVDEVHVDDLQALWGVRFIPAPEGPNGL